MKLIKRILFSVGVMLMMFGSFFNIKASAEDEKNTKDTVKVAYFDMGDYYTTDENGEIISYDRAYLDKISEYSGLQFEYVDCKTWENALDMLDKHEVDLVGTMQLSRNRDARFQMCRMKYGVTYATLCAIDDDIMFEDYDAIRGCNLGIVDGYVNEVQLNKLIENHNLQMNITRYTTQAELLNAVKTGKIDVAACNSHTIDSSMNIIEKYEYSPFFFASWRGNTELTDAIDDAILKMEMYDSEYQDKLMKKYFPRIITDPISREEYDYIESQPDINMYFEPDAKPLAWKNRQGEMNGILIDICEEISRNTKLNFVYNSISDDERTGNYFTFSMKWSDGVNNLMIDKESNTESILRSEFLLFHKLGKKYDIHKSYTIATPDNRQIITDYLKITYPNCKIIEYDHPSQCVEAVRDGRADMFFMNYYVSNAYLIENNYTNIVEIPTSHTYFDILLTYYGENAEIIKSIMDKGIAFIDNQTIQDIQLDYALDIYPDVDVEYLFKNNAEEFLAVACIIFVLIIVIVIVAARNMIARRHHAELKRANQAKSDFLSQMSHDIRTPMN